MDKQFVRDLAVKAQVASPFVVKSKSLAPFRNKPGRFLNITLGDRTGEIKGRVWDKAEEIAARFEVGDVVAVSGRVDEYQGQLQIIASDVAKAEAGSYDPTDLVERADKSEEELLDWLDSILAEVTNPHLSALLSAFISDEEFKGRFARAHGSKTLHHAYEGGLLEHTLSVLEVLRTVADLHPEIDRDLLLTGGVLHDIGKLEELEGEAAVEYSDVGRFIGHTVITDRMVRKRIRDIEGFPEELANLLSHMLLSHHGEREWGAPVVPMTMEACALHYADNLDARVQGFKRIIRNAGDSPTGWSEFQRPYQRMIYLGPPAETPDDDAPPDGQ